jgi:aryl sulfotransferase
MASQSGSILWLASYPKSGNTWFRVFYTNLIRDDDVPADINELLPAQIASGRALFDDYAGVESSNLLPDEIEWLRPRVYEAMAREEKEVVLQKIHDACIRTARGEWLISDPVTRGAIYFLRNPLDVAVSFAHHSSCGIDIIIERMADESYCLNSKPDRIGNQFRQRLLSWSSHVTSWVEGLGAKLLLMRYEDMVLDPVGTFTRAVRFARLPDDPARIRKALRFSDIREMQKQERACGFKEKSQTAESFFKKGTIGAWRETLTDRQAARIIHDHGAVMKRFGYLDDHDEPRF